MWTRVRSDIWPPLRPTRLLHWRGSVGVVLRRRSPSTGGLACGPSGLDVHKHLAEVAILNEGDRTSHRGDRVDATPAALRAFAASRVSGVQS